MMIDGIVISLLLRLVLLSLLLLYGYCLHYAITNTISITCIITNCYYYYDYNTKLVVPPELNAFFHSAPCVSAVRVELGGTTRRPTCDSFCLLS